MTQAKTKRYKKAIDAYEKQCEKALDRLVKAIEPDLRQACERWGFDFFAGMGSWTIYFKEKHPEQKYRKIEGHYHLLGDARFLLDFLEPELAEMLETAVENQSLGSLMNNIKVPKDDYDWVAIKADGWCLDRPIDKPPEIIASVNKMDAEYAYFGWIPKEVALIVVAEYNQDWDSGSQLLASLPSLVEEDLKILAT